MLVPKASSGITYSLKATATYIWSINLSTSEKCSFKYKVPSREFYLDSSGKKVCMSSQDGFNIRCGFTIARMNPATSYSSCDTVIGI